MIQSLATSQHWKEVVRLREECAGEDGLNKDLRVS